MDEIKVFFLKTRN